MNKASQAESHWLKTGTSQINHCEHLIIGVFCSYSAAFPPPPPCLTMRTVRPLQLLRQANSKRVQRVKTALEAPLFIKSSVRSSHQLSSSSQLVTQNPHILAFFTSKRISNTGNQGNDGKEQVRLANLGSMVDYLTAIIPEALNKIPVASKLDEGIQLRIAPSISNVPIIKGQLSYTTSLKATQLIFKNFILDNKTKLHVLRAEVDYSNNYGILGSGVTKIVIHWKTCDEVCHHLADGDEIRNQSTSDVDKHRVLYGIFVFELNGMNDMILVHNVENLEICDDHEKKISDVFGGNFATSAN